jgi:hypothetical protein
VVAPGQQAGALPDPGLPGLDCTKECAVIDPPGSTPDLAEPVTGASAALRHPGELSLAQGVTGLSDALVAPLNGRRLVRLA